MSLRPYKTSLVGGHESVDSRNVDSGSTVSSRIGIPNSVSPSSDSPNIHSLIANGSWLELAKFLETEEYSESVKIPSNKLEFPLHMAVDRKAPSFIIQALVREYPEAAAIVDLKGNYPIHSACQRILPPASLYNLICACPEALLKKNKDGRTPSFYRQYDKTSNEYLTKPHACWIASSYNYKSNINNLNRIATLQKQKIQMKNELENARSRIRVQKDTLNVINTLAEDFPEKEDIPKRREQNKELIERLRKLEKYSTEKIITIKNRLAKVKEMKEKELELTKTMNTPENHSNNNNYVEQVAERIKVLKQDLGECRKDIDTMMHSKLLLS